MAAPAQAATVDAGSLRADTGGAEWRLRLTGRDGRDVLAEGEGARLGFRTGAGWFRATRVLEESSEGATARLRVATDDPLGRVLDVRLAPDAEGVIALDATVTGPLADQAERVGIGFTMGADERFIGFGERSNAVDQRGNEVLNYVGEGPYQPEERPFIAAAVPPAAYNPRDDASHYPVPWLLSTAGYGVLVDNDETSRFHLGDERADVWSADADGARLRVRVFAGPTPAGALRRFTARTGRQPRPAAPWFLGVWVMPGDFDREDVPAEMERVRKLRDADTPVSMAETTMQYLPCGDHRPLREVTRQRVAGFNGAGLGVLAYAHSQVCVDYQPVYDDLAARGLFIRDTTGRPYVYKQFADRHQQVVVSQFDFTAPGSEDAFTGLLGEMARDGYEGWMEDYGEYTPTDGRFSDGSTGVTRHNRFPTDYHCAARGATRGARPALGAFVRSGWTGTAACAQLVWSGDPTADWGFDGLASAVMNGVNMGASGVGLWASELGGIFELGTRELTPELLVRWIEFGAVSPWMKARKKSIAIPDKGERPQVWDDDILPTFRRYAKLHTQLYPYLVAAAERYRRDGMPLMRHLALAFPGDPGSRARDDEFLFGPHILAAPVTGPGQRSRELYVPPGRWVDLWRSARYLRRSGGLRLVRARQLGGRAVRTLPAPLDEIPLLVRAGAVLPLLPPDVDTLSRHGAPDLVELRERRGRMQLLAFPRGHSSARFNRRERIRSREGRGSWTLAIAGARVRRYDLQASLATLRRPFRPCSVRARGRALPFRFDRRTRVLRARLRGRSPVLRVSGC